MGLTSASPYQIVEHNTLQSYQFPILAGTTHAIFTRQGGVSPPPWSSLNLGSKVGLKVPVSPQRGQILVTEKIAHFLDYPTIYARQTEEGSVLLGDSHEDVGFNDGTTPKVIGDIARRACQIFPHLAKARIVRAWGALRILTPDGLPVYDQSTECPGAFSASAHSGVTLAAAHALDFASFVVDGALPDTLNALSERRFHVH